MNEMGKILHGLAQRTDDGKLKWRRTVKDTEFVAAIDTIAITIRQLGKGAVGFPGRYQIEIYNEEGSTAEIVETPDEFGLLLGDTTATADQSRQLEHLYVLARRSALNTQATLDRLVKALES